MECRRQCSVLLLFLLTAGVCPPVGRTAPGSSNKAKLVVALGRMRDLARELSLAPNQERLRTPADKVYRSARWLHDEAKQWVPKKGDEGKQLLESVEAALALLQGAVERGTESPRFEEILQAVGSDLEVKHEHCRKFGLTARQRVSVATKHETGNEVKGLAVLYVEAFYQFQPSLRAQEFDGFSSPAKADLVPGRYVIWAKQPKRQEHGERKLVRIGNAERIQQIEVLAP
jgi:hypothetical protein